MIDELRETKLQLKQSLKIIEDLKIKLDESNKLLDANKFIPSAKHQLPIDDTVQASISKKDVLAKRKF